MADLIIELALALLAASLIGWLLGRFLCKSGEYDERAEKRRLGSELAALAKDLETSRQSADGLHRQLGDQAAAAALVEQERSGLSIRLDAAQGEVRALLQEIRELEVEKVRHGVLEAELEDRQDQVLHLKSTCTDQAEEIARLRGREAEAEGEGEARIAALRQENSNLEQQLVRLGDEHGWCLQRLETLAASIDGLHRRIRERTASGRRSP